MQLYSAVQQKLDGGMLVYERTVFMTEQVKNEIIAKINEAESILGEYIGKTNEILNTDIDETLEDILEARDDTSVIKALNAPAKWIKSE